MQIAYGNCVKHAEQRTWDAWGRELENGLTGGGINLFRARFVRSFIHRRCPPSFGLPKNWTFKYPVFVFGPL